ncbi:MAG TPA: hypothetical protein VLA43_20540 [Longimicrobiales bacterium]|nr:hypothetical protein [Longimicrobiales bacterium]
MRNWITDVARSFAVVLGSLGLLAAFTALAWTPPAAEADELQARQESVLRGRQLVIEHGCGGCHGGFDNPAAEGWLAGLMSASQEFPIGPCGAEGDDTCFLTRPRNLTPHPTTGIGRFSERQIFNALRFGLRPGETADVEITSTVPGEGNYPMFPKYLAPPMPWHAWRHMPDEDLWAIAAYLKEGLKPVDNFVPDSEGPPDFWVSTYTVEAFGTHPAQPFPTGNEVEPPSGVDRELVVRGRHLVIQHACGDCHGGLTNPAAPGWLAGIVDGAGAFPAGPCLEDPEAPCFMQRPRNLTPHPTAGTGRWTERQLFNAIRHGLRPSGNPDAAITAANFPVNADLLGPGMPWGEFRHMPDQDIRAIVAYLRNGLKPVDNVVEESDRPAEGWSDTFESLLGGYPAPPFPTAREVGG